MRTKPSLGLLGACTSAVLAGAAYTGNAADLASLSPARQQAEWTQPLGAPLVDIFHLLPDDRLLVGALAWDPESNQFSQRELRLLSTRDGNVLWSAKRKEMHDASYALVGVSQNVVVLQAAGQKETALFAYGLPDGKSVWTYTVKGTAAISPVADTRTLLVASSSGIRALDITSGTESWSVSAEPRVGGTIPEVVVTPETVCVLGKALTCLDRQSGKERWSAHYPDDAAVGRGFVVGSRLVVATDMGLAAWDLKSGAAQWRSIAPVPGLVDVSLGDNTVYPEWLDTTGAVKAQSVAIADGKVRWTSEPLPVPRSAIVIAGDIGYFSSASLAVAMDMRTGKVTARSPLPMGLIDTERKPDDVIARDDGVTIVNELGAASYGWPGLGLRNSALMHVGGTRPDAERELQEELRTLQKDNSPGTPLISSLQQVSQSSVLSNAAQARIQLAYAHVRPVLTSSNSSNAQKAAAHVYVQHEIAGAISTEQAAISLGKLEAAADLANSVLGVMEAMQAAKRRAAEANIGLHRYFIWASDLRNEGTPMGYAMASGVNNIELYDFSRNAIGDLIHSTETRYGWQHIAVLTSDGGHLVGAHVKSAPANTTGVYTSDTKRPNLDIERYDLSRIAWRPAESPAAEDELLASIRTGKLTSLTDRYGPCYMSLTSPAHLALRTGEMTMAAVMGHNLPMLREMRVNGQSGLSRASFRIDTTVVARDMMDRDITTFLEDAARRERADIQLAALVRQDDRDKARAAIDAGGNPDGVAPLSATQTCNYPLLQFAPSAAMRSLLIEKGAHVNILDTQRQTLVDFAVRKKDRSLERFLREHGGKAAAEL